MNSPNGFHTRVPAAPMPAAVRLAVFVVAILGFTGPAASAAPPAPAVADSSARVRSDDGSGFECRRLTLPGTVNAVAYDSSSRILVTSYNAKLVVDPATGRLERPRVIAEPHCLAYDLAHRRVLWDARRDLLPLSVHTNRLLALQGRKIAILDLANGEGIRALPEDAFLMIRDSILVTRSGGGIERIDLETGEPSWRLPLAIAARQLSAFCPDSVLYLTGAGLAAADLSGGLIWEYPMRLARSDVASSVFQNVIAIGISLVALAPVIPVYWGTHIEMASERPLLRGSRLYASADTEVVCVSRLTGHVFWRRRLGMETNARLRTMMGIGGPEWPGQTLVRDAGTAIAVLGLGFAREGSRVWRADPGTLTLLDPESGATLRRLRIGREQFLRDYRRVPAGHLVLARDRLFVLDDRLSIRDTLPLPAGHLEAIGFVDVDSLVLVRTNAGILELDPGSLELRWERRLGGGGVTTAPHGIGTRMWMIGRHGLLGHWLGGERPPVWIPFDAGAAAFSGGAAITLTDRTVEIIPLPPDDR